VSGMRFIAVWEARKGNVSDVCEIMAYVTATVA
jgi:hypothetical protein